MFYVVQGVVCIYPFLLCATEPCAGGLAVIHRRAQRTCPAEAVAVYDQHTQAFVVQMVPWITVAINTCYKRHTLCLKVHHFVSETLNL